MRQNGVECSTTAEELRLWFQADTPFDGDGVDLDYVLKSPLLVIHELVEIGEVKRMGLALTKDVIVRNIEKVDDAHLKAAAIELRIATSMRDRKHLRSRARDIKRWSEDATVTEGNKEAYRGIYRQTMHAVSAMAPAKRKWPLVAAVLAVVAVSDIVTAIWAIPYADEHYTTPYGSIGFVIAMLATFVTFITLLALLTYSLQHDSYESDRWY